MKDYVHIFFVKLTDTMFICISLYTNQACSGKTTAEFVTNSLNLKLRKSDLSM